MLAKEMFERLGYRTKDDRLYIEYEISEECYFIFSKNFKIINIGAYEIDIDELKAINQQCKELGWVE